MEMCRPGWVFLQFLAELENVVVDGARRRIILITPYFGQQFVAADLSIGILHQKLKRFEFLGGQKHGLPIAFDFHFLEVDGNVVKADYLLIGSAGGVAKRGPHTGQQFPGTEWLGHIVIGAQLEQQDFVADIAGRTEHDDRQCGGECPDFFAYIEAREFGKAQVKNHGCRRRRLEAAERGPAVGLRLYGVSRRLKETPERFLDGAIVFDDEDTASGLGRTSQIHRSSRPEWRGVAHKKPSEVSSADQELGQC
jgi:hypothetical protein